MTERYVAAIDQGTASSRCLVFDRRARIVSVAQKEHRHHFPRPGWVEHDPEEIWRNVLEVVDEALAKAELSPADLSALGIANQRETTVLWDRRTGTPVHNAINWEDTRTDQLCRELAGDVRAGPLPREDRAAARHLLLGPEGALAAGPRPGAARARRGGRGPVRHDRLVADLEPVRAPRDRRDQRQPHDADGPRYARVGRRAAVGDRRPARRCSPRSARRRRSTARRARRWPGVPVASAARRPACGAAWARPALTRARRSAPMAPAASSRSTPASAPVALGQRAAHRRSDTTSASASRRTRWRDRSRSPARWCSGSATTSD